MKIITGIAVLNTGEGERITYTYSEVDEFGNITQSNIKKSFIAVDDETKGIVANLRAKVNEREGI